MASRAQQVFTEAVLDLDPDERLQLASLILQDLTRPEVALVAIRDHWSEHDQADLASFSLQLAVASYPQADELC